MTTFVHISCHQVLTGLLWPSTECCMIFSFDNYRSYLKAEQANRVQNDPQYSLRTFAKFLGLAPSMLSDVTRNKRGLSLRCAKSVAHRLGLDHREAEYFLLLVEIDGCKDEILKSDLLKKLEALRPFKGVEQEIADAKMLSQDWIHIAIISLAKLERMKLHYKLVAQTLGIRPVAAEAAIERLARLKILLNSPDEDEVYYLNKEKNLENYLSEGSQYLFQQQILALAQKSLERKTVHERVILSEIVSFGPEQISQVKNLASEFVQKVKEISQEGSENPEIYNLGLQFFPLSEHHEHH